MTEAIIRKYFVDFVKSLPMNDAEFRAMLYSANLLPGDLWGEMQSKSTSAEKAEHFLHYGIKNDTETFNKLLTVMKGYNDDQLKRLAEKIYSEADLQPPLSKKRKIDIHVLEKVQNKLKTAYKQLCNSDYPHHYIQLALVRDKVCSIHDKKLNEITRHTLQGQVDEIKKIKEPLIGGLEDIFHYNDSFCPRLILILGAPGIGKTTLVNEISLKWALYKDCFLSHDFDLVILIRLRTVQENTLQQMLIQAVGSEEAYAELLTKTDGERCLIILEGLDEISIDWQKNNSTFCQLIKNTFLLSNANILVTSRPHACIYLHNDIKSYARTIEIVGFDEPQVKEYAESFFNNSSTAEKFMEQVKNNPHISSLCYVPLCLNMVLECFRHSTDILHTTLTELYQSFILSKIHEHTHSKKAVSLGAVLDNNKQRFKILTTVLSNVHGLCEGTLETMFLLSKLAYKSYFEWFECEEYSNERNPKIVYSDKDLFHCSITNSASDACGLLKATNTLFATSNIAVYAFNHLSVQEYFCALYISLLPENQQLQLLKDHITDYPHMWPFYAGITKLKSPNVLDYLYQFLLPNKQLLNTDFIDCNMTLQSCSDNHQTPVVLNSIFEAQLSSSVCSKYKETFLVMPSSSWEIL